MFSSLGVEGTPWTSSELLVFARGSPSRRCCQARNSLSQETPKSFKTRHAPQHDALACLAPFSMGKTEAPDSSTRCSLCRCVARPQTKSRTSLGLSSRRLARLRSCGHELHHCARQRVGLGSQPPWSTEKITFATRPSARPPPHQQRLKNPRVRRTP